MANTGPIDLSTRPRVPLRILLRVIGANMHDLAVRFAAFKVAVLGDAKREKWEGLWRPGDLEAIAWVPASEVNASLANLRAFP